VPVLQQMPRPQLATETGLDRSTRTRLRNGHTRPQLAHRAVLIRTAEDSTRAQLAAAGKPTPSEGLAACAEWLAWQER
jgi:hypothetical protein